MLDCSYNLLKTLEGCPSSVIALYCNGNQLTTLEGCSPNVTKLYCYDNQLTTLEGCPPSVTILYRNDNPLAKQYQNKSLEEIHNINRIKAFKKGISSIDRLISALKIQRRWRKWWYEELDSEDVNRFIKKSFMEFMKH